MPATIENPINLRVITIIIETGTETKWFYLPFVDLVDVDGFVVPTGLEGNIVDSRLVYDYSAINGKIQTVPVPAAETWTLAPFIGGFSTVPIRTVSLIGIDLENPTLIVEVVIQTQTVAMPNLVPNASQGLPGTVPEDNPISLRFIRFNSLSNLTDWFYGVFINVEKGTTLPEVFPHLEQFNSHGVFVEGVVYDFPDLELTAPSNPEARLLRIFRFEPGLGEPTFPVAIKGKNGATVSSATGQIVKHVDWGTWSI